MAQCFEEWRKEQNSSQRYEIPKICSVSFDVIAASIMSGANEISGAFHHENGQVCLRYKEILEGSQMNAVSIGYCPFSFHSHPLVAYCTDHCSLGSPSGDDFRAWVIEAIDTARLPAIHYTVCIEGTYVVRVRPVPEGVSGSSVPQKVFKYFSKYHNQRSAKRFTPDRQISPNEFCDIVNKTTWRDLTGIEGHVGTVFDMLFFPHVVVYDGRRFCGSEDGCGESLTAFYRHYVRNKVEKTCHRLQSCHRTNKGKCDLQLSRLQQCELVYDPDHPYRDALFYYEREMYSRMLMVMSTQGVKTFEEVYDMLFLGKWCFAMNTMHTCVVDGEVYQVNNEAECACARVCSCDKNVKRAMRLSEIRVKISTLLDFLEEVKNNPETAVEELLWGSRLLYYHRTNAYGISEIPVKAMVLTKSAAWESRDIRDSLGGLNKPMGVSVDRKKCERKELFFNIDGGGLHGLILHELTHSALGDHIWRRNNHLFPFHKCEGWLTKAAANAAGRSGSETLF